MEITVLCKVVDNYGDIGFVYRLAKNLTEINSTINLRLVVSNMESFAKMAPEISDIGYQEYKNWRIFDWNDENLCKAEFSARKPKVILQCFQCGYPEWLEEILFDSSNKDACTILNVEYLTAEEWADDFHLLKGGTPNPAIKKNIFMPGFTNKTGGLVLNKSFVDFVRDRNCAIEKVCSVFSVFKPEYFDGFHENYTFFSYPQDLTFFAKAFNSYAGKISRPINIFAANGISLPAIRSAFEDNINDNINLVEIPYLNQDSWDALLTLCNGNFIRGEDSFARSTLCGTPFLWHAYVQDEEYQLVKVNAILHRIKPFLSAKFYDCFALLTVLYNISGIGGGTIQLNEGNFCPEARQVLDEYKIDGRMDIEAEKARCLEKMLLEYDHYMEDFKSFSRSLFANGNLTEHLLSFLLLN